MRSYIFCLLLLLNTAVLAVSIDAKKFASAEQEATYSTLIAELRCLVCQNENIANSNADLAKDLRRQVAEMVNQGKSKQEIKHYMQTRYGDFVLYRPPFKIKTGLLWIGPFAFLLIGLIVIYLYARRKKRLKTITLNEEEK